MKNIRVILLGRYGHPNDTGGVANAMANLLRIAREFPIRFDVVSIRSESLITRQLIETAQYDNPNVKVHVVGSKKGFYPTKNPDFEASTEELAQIVKSILDTDNNEGSDDVASLVHVMTMYPHYVRTAQNLADRLQVPYIVSARGSDVYGHNTETTYDPDTYWYHSPLRRASVITSLSDYLIGEIVENLKEITFDVPIRKVRNGVDTDVFVPHHKERIPKNTIRAAYTGRIRRFKGLMELIQAIEHCRKKGVDIELDLYGPYDKADNGIFEEISGYLQAHTLSEHIRCTGEYIPNRTLPELYKQHNLFLYASRGEGLPNAVMEAMACGLPVILNHESCASDFVENPNLVFRSGHIDEIVKCICYFVENPGSLIQESERNRTFAVDHHWGHILTKYMEIYQDVLRR